MKASIQLLAICVGICLVAGASGQQRRMVATRPNDNVRRPVGLPTRFNLGDTLRQGVVPSGQPQSAEVLKMAYETFPRWQTSPTLGQTPPTRRSGSGIAISDDLRAVVQANNRFAFDLFRVLRAQEGNLVASPASISTALAMPYGGAGGQTQREMGSVLHLSAVRRPHEGFSAFLNLLNSKADGCSLSTGNRLFGAKDYPFADAFLRLTRDQYRAEVKSLDFHAPEQARESINAWVSQQTGSKIAELLSAGVLQPNTRLVLANAIYFDGDWMFPFTKSATVSRPFLLSADNKIDVPTMRQTREFSYAENADTQVVSLPYHGGELSMVVMLPKAIDGLPQLEMTLMNERFGAWLAALRGGRPVQLDLPKFDLRSGFLLSQPLTALGMTSAFGAGADFSGISTAEGLMISEVVHQSFIEVDETGTEAAAATAVVGVPYSSMLPRQDRPQPIVFRADHPFLFLIVDHRTSAVLFLGRVMQPRG
jgi:serpin B